MIKKIRVILIGGIFLCLGTVLCIYTDSYRDYGKNADCAIVYGNKVHVNGRPSKRLMARLDAAYQLYTSGMVKKVIVSGGNGKEGHNEAAVMADYLIQKGINKDYVLIDPDGYTTSKTSLNSAELIDKQSTVIAVSQQYHISRAKLSLKNAGFEKVQGYFPKYYEVRDIYSALREVPAWFKYWITKA